MLHELTNKLIEQDTVYEYEMQQKEDKIITDYLKEKAEIIRKEIFGTCDEHKVDEIFGLKEQTLEKSRFTIEGIIQEAVGEASMCWEKIDKAGVFQSDQALDVAQRTTQAIKSAIKERMPKVIKCVQCDIPYTDCGCATYNRCIRQVLFILEGL